MLRQLRYSLEALVAALFWSVAYLLGRRGGCAFGAFLAPLVGRFTRYQKIGAENIKMVFPRMSPAKRAELLRRVWQNFGRAICEYPHLGKLDPCDEQAIKVVGALPARGKPVVFFSAHLANWEVMGVALSRMLNKKVLIAERPQNNPWVRFMISRFRRHGQVIPVPKSKRLMREFMRVLSDGGSIACLIDQRERGRTIKFLGRDAQVNTGLAALALKVSAELAPVRLERTEDNNFVLTLEPPLKISGNESAASLLGKMYARIEEWIYRNPEQWLWFHRRWRS